MNNLVLLAIFFGAITHIASASPTSDPAPGNDLLDIDEVLKKFKDCDENDDGKLSAGECVNQWTGDGSNFNEVDADGDGEVTWKEMKAAAAAIIAEDRVIQSSRARGAYVDLRYVPAPGITAEWLKGKKKGEGDCDRDGDCRGYLKCGDSNCKYIWRQSIGWHISPVGTVPRCTSRHAEDKWYVNCDDCCE